MEHSCRALRAGAAALALVAVSLHASTPKFFNAATQADFLKADLENLSVDGRGQLTLGPATDVVYETAAPFLWALVPMADGSFFIGSGNDGKVFRVDASGRGSTFFDATELEVHAMAPAPNGGLYVGTSPDGKIYRVDRGGSASVFFDPEDKYIWGLATDAGGNVYAATGDKGVVYKIDPSGKGQPFYRTKATHAIAIAVDKSGNLLIGTESPGRLLRVDGQGRGFLVLDTPYDEIRTLRFDDKGFLYAAAVKGRTGTASPSSSGGEDRTPDRPPPDPTRPPIPTVTTEVTSVAVVDSSGSGAGSTREDYRAARGAIYRVAPDGLWDQLWESREDMPYDLIFDRDGRLIVATGNKGKLYRLEGDPLRPALLARAAAQQVTALHRDAKGALYYTTSNPGKLFRLSSDTAQRGTYESEIHDAKMVATWGNVSWRASVPQGARIEMHTRSGNSEAPDDTWSPWSPAYTQSEGSPIASPKARYLQWRAVLSGRGQSPVLTSVSAAYLQRNLRPQVRSITVHSPGIVFQKPYSTGDPDLAGFDNQTTPDRKLAAAAASQGSPSSLGRRGYEKGLQTLAWRADDDNGDELVYEVQYRREGEPAWKVLRRSVSETILVWDTTVVSNGTYFVRVVASDSPSNGPEQALLGELDSAAFEIDNSPPAFRSASARADGPRTIVTFDVVDDSSPIERVECSRDGQQWWTVFPRDGIADSKTERYEVRIDGELGPRGLSVRATDSMNNVATTQIDQPRR